MTEDKAIHKRWTEYCTKLYSYKLQTDASILKNEDDVENRETGESPILKEEVEKAVRTLKDGKPPGADNIQQSFPKHGGPGIIDALTVVCQKLWTSGQWPKDWTKSLIIHLLQKSTHDVVRTTERSARFVTLVMSRYE